VSAGRPRPAPPAPAAVQALAAVLALGALAAVGVAAATRLRAAAGGGWVEVRHDDLVLAVPVSGTLAAVDAAHLGPPAVEEIWDFKIVSMAAEGSQVRRGQPVIAFDTTDLEKTLHDEEAQRDTAEKKLERKRADLEMSRRDDQLHLAEAAADRRRAELEVAVPPELKQRNELASARADLLLATHKMEHYRERLRLTAGAAAAELRVLAAQRDAAAARVAAARSAIARMTVAAPRDGTVVYVADHRGEKKKVGDSCWRFAKVIEIPDLRRLRADGELDEADAGRVAAGQPVALRLDAHPDVAFSGRVRTLHGALRRPSFNRPVKVFDLEIDLERTDPMRMRPGMRFVGTVEVERAAGTVVAPLDAVRSLAGGPLVYRRAAFGVEAVRPRLGRHNDRWVEVLSGLAPGDQLRLPGGASRPDGGAGSRVNDGGGGGGAGTARGASPPRETT
jgi:HlyD family secretion protein